MNRAVPVMGVGPPGPPCRRRPQTAAMSCRSRAGVGSDCGDGPLTAGQVGAKKTNVSEPLLKHRNIQRWHQNQGETLALGQEHASGVLVAGRWPAGCPGGARCGGGVSLAQALVWNSGTCRADSDGQSKGVLMAPWSQEGEPRGPMVWRGRVPMRRTGADRLVVATKVL